MITPDHPDPPVTSDDNYNTRADKRLALRYDIYPENIPAELKAIPHWILWGYGEKDGEIVKVPIDPKTGVWVSAHDPKNWMTFDESMNYAKKLNLGIGFDFTKDLGYVFIDWDHILKDGVIQDPRIREIIDKGNTSTEVSPSGEGLHQILKSFDFNFDSTRMKHLPIRKIVKKYHISFSVYSEIKNSAINKPIQTETVNTDVSPKKETVKNNEPVNVKTTGSKGTSKTGIMNENEEYKNKEAKNDKILDIKPSPRIKPKKFRFPRIGKENTLLITYRGRFYFEYVLPDFPKEMQDELAESIADCVVEFMRKHKETTFTIIRED